MGRGGVMRDGRKLLTSVRPEVELDSKVSGVSTNWKVSPTAYDRRLRTQS